MSVRISAEDHRRQRTGLQFSRLCAPQAGCYQIPKAQRILGGFTPLRLPPHEVTDGGGVKRSREEVALSRLTTD
jgi:hypothetical protein